MSPKAVGRPSRPQRLAPSATSAKEVSPAPLLPVELPESLKKPYTVLTAMDRLLAQEPNAEYERAFVRESLGTIEAWRMRTAVDPVREYSAP